MKVLTKVLMTALILGATIPMLAKENNSLETLVTLKELDQGKIQLTYHGKTPADLYVRIYNEKDREVFKETIRSKTGIKKPYNITGLPYGKYRFEVRVADETIEHKINHEAPIYSGKAKLMVTSLNESKFKMMVVGPEYKDFKLWIYDERGSLLFQENFQQSGNVGRIFDLKATRSRTVELVLIHKDKVVQSKLIKL